MRRRIIPVGAAFVLLANCSWALAQGHMHGFGGGGGVAWVAAALFMHPAGDFEADPAWCRTATSRGRRRTGLSARQGWSVAIAPSVEGELSRDASSIPHVVIVNGRAAPSRKQAVQSHEEWTVRNACNVSLSRAAMCAERTG